MTNEEVKEYLCYYDTERDVLISSDTMTVDEISKAKENCACDNCFYGRTKLAKEIVRLKLLLGINK